MDGIDVAMIRTDGEAMVEAMAFETVDYDAAQRALLSEAMALSAGLRDPADPRPGKLAAIERRQSPVGTPMQLTGSAGSTVLQRQATWSLVFMARRCCTGRISA